MACAATAVEKGKRDALVLEASQKQKELHKTAKMPFPPLTGKTKEEVLELQKRRDELKDS